MENIYGIRGIQTIIDRDMAIVYGAREGWVTITDEQWEFLISQIMFSCQEMWNGIQEFPFAFSSVALRWLTEIFIAQHCIPANTVLIKAFVEIKDRQEAPRNAGLFLEEVQEVLLKMPPDGIRLMYVYESQDKKVNQASGPGQNGP